MIIQLKNRKSEKGQGLVEYALILTLVSVVAIVALSVVGTTVEGVFIDIYTALSGDEVIRYPRFGDDWYFASYNYLERNPTPEGCERLDGQNGNHYAWGIGLNGEGCYYQ